MTSKDTNISAVATHVPGLFMQAATISTLLVFTFGDTVQTLLSVVASLIWLDVSKGRQADRVCEWRAARDLFVQVGEWLDREDADEVFDQTLAERMQVEQGITHDDFDGVLVAQNIANLARSVMRNLVYGYLLVLLTVVLAGKLSG